MPLTFHETVHSWLTAHEGAVRDHVILSTLVLGALLAASMLPALRPRTRYVLVLLGVAKFFLPSSLLVPLGGSLHAVTLPSFSMTATFGSSAGTSPQSDVLCLLAAVWMAGTIAVVIRLTVAQRRWRGTVRQARAVSEREVTALQRVAHRSTVSAIPRLARSATGFAVTAGFTRPVVLLPPACAADLEDDELDAVLAHELAHVERRHNLTAALSNAAGALFWFNPALWIARSRLEAEAEKDCDERVLHFVPDPPTYFSGMLKVSYGFIAPQPAGVSCMSTSRLKERMDHLMKHHESDARTIPHRLAMGLAIAAVVLTTMFVSAGTPAVTPSDDPAPSQADDITPPRLVTRVNPTYPAAAREKRIEGLVILVLAIDDKGNVTGVSVKEGIEGEEGKSLEQAATEAVKQWKWEPAQKGGKPVSTNYTVTIKFKLS